MLLTKFNWRKEVLESQEPVLVDFWAEWCGPCRTMSPVLDSLAKTYKVCKVNVDKNQALAEAYKVSSIPALMVLHGGKVVAQHLGVTAEAVLRADLERFRKT